MFRHVHEECGDDVELLHDVHERSQPQDTIYLMKQLEPYRPFFIEDPVSPENRHWFQDIRKNTSVPIAMGELFNNPNEQEAARYPLPHYDYDWTQVRKNDRARVRPRGGIASAGRVRGVRIPYWLPLMGTIDSHSRFTPNIKALNRARVRRAHTQSLCCDQKG